MYRRVTRFTLLALFTGWFTGCTTAPPEKSFLEQLNELSWQTLEKSTPQPTSLQPGTPIKIGTWNMAILGPSWKKNGKDWSPKEETRNPEHFAKYIAHSKVSILALQEVADSPDTKGLRNKSLDQICTHLRTNGFGNWTYRLTRGTESKKQLCGLLWNASLFRRHGGPMPLPLPKKRYSKYGFGLLKRHPHATRLDAGSGLSDYVFIPIHLKANGGKPETVPHRKLEAELIVKQLNNIDYQLHDSDIIVLGDFNSLDHTEPALQVFRKAGFIDVNEEDLPTHLNERALDRIIFREKYTPEIDIAPQVEQPPGNPTEKEFRAHFSDHYMLTTRLTIQPDDD